MLASGEKLKRIRRIAGEVVNTRREGCVVDYMAILHRYPELMPELGDKLSRLKAIELAALRAESADAESHDPSRVDPQLEFLRKNMTECEILERIDYGGQGIVYKALHRPTKRTVALKILLDGGLASESQRRRFAREVELIARLQHPNVVAVHDTGEIEGRPYVIMEFVDDGLPIDDFVQVHELSTRQVVKLFETVCRAVQAAHQNGVLHRDLKPSNLLVDGAGQPHVLDFGLAKDLTVDGRNEDLSITGQVVGTLPYMSPEQAAGQTESVDVRSDIYSLGVVLYQLLVDELPYPVDGDRSTVVQNILTVEPSLRKAISRRRIQDSDSRPRIDDDLEKIVLKALAKEPGRRYQSVDALADDLRRYLVGDAVYAKSASRIYLLRKTARKFRIPIAVGTTFVFLLISALVAVTIAWRGAERVTQLANSGLEMGSLIKLGSVERDGGRVDQAVAMFKQVIDMAKVVPTQDRVIQSQLFGAHYSLAMIFLDRNILIDAKLHTDQAVRLAEHLHEIDSADAKWRQHLANAELLNGRLAFANKNYETSLAIFERVGKLNRELLALEPENVSLLSDQGAILGLHGWAARRLKRFDLSLHSYTEAYEIYSSLHTRDPENPSHLVELVRSESKLSNWHVVQKTAEHDEEAGLWLDRAESHLKELRGSPRAFERQRDVDQLGDELQKNRAWLVQKLSRDKPGQSQPVSGPPLDSTGS
ncbi:MAG: serine/threonine protein kinase [Planctomycetes bacterium]|nr:serine/threonine protein kinase [Planctomycetota bacterium]